ncbi:MAG: EpsG family protein [Prevotellaceae bacterium]|nr:EpsG family protein [Candidatus Minthosoma equi]
MEQLFSFIPIAIYTKLFMWLVFVFCMIIGGSYLSSNNNQNLLTVHNPLPTLILAIVVTLYMGLRPDHYQFGDSYFYRHTYYNIAVDSTFSTDTEWLFALIQNTCRGFRLNHHIFFFIIEIGYIGFLYAACRKLLWENTWMAMLFCISSFSFFTYGVNGIRNGLAMHLLLFAFALLADCKKWIVPVVVVLCFAAFGIHRTSIVPVSAALIAYFVIKDPKWAIYIWISCILLSLVAGGFFQNLLGTYLGAADARAASYTAQTDMSQFSRSGFRWDFILYSSVPVILTYYVTVKKHIQNRTFNILATTYIMANSVWVLVNSMAFSNRVAYLSWFLYPIVIAYALIRLHIWDDQDKKSAMWLMGLSAFTIFMMLLGK